jgi:hypothetical protein
MSDSRRQIDFSSIELNYSAHAGWEDGSPFSVLAASDKQI